MRGKSGGFKPAALKGLNTKLATMLRLIIKPFQGLRLLGVHFTHRFHRGLLKFKPFGLSMNPKLQLVHHLLC
jgi:hypothetical protein